MATKKEEVTFKVRKRKINIRSREMAGVIHLAKYTSRFAVLHF